VFDSFPSVNLPAACCFSIALLAASQFNGSALGAKFRDFPSQWSSVSQWSLALPSLLLNESIMIGKL